MTDFIHPDSERVVSRPWRSGTAGAAISRAVERVLDFVVSRVCLAKLADLA